MPPGSLHVSSYIFTDGRHTFHPTSLPIFAAPSESLNDLLKTSQLPNRGEASLGQKTNLNKTFTPLFLTALNLLFYCRIFI